MKLPPIVVGTLLLAACASSGVRDSCITGERSFMSNEHLAARGRHTVIENVDYLVSEIEKNPLPRWREFLRTGSWLYFYDSGREQARVTYKIGSYTECCTAGYCDQPYEYLVGEFEAWWPNGRLLVRGRLTPSSVHKDTNCDGGATVFHGIPSADTKYWTADGSPGDSSLLQQAGIFLDEL
jgi:hypothetical protein